MDSFSPITRPSYDQRSCSLSKMASRLTTLLVTTLLLIPMDPTAAAEVLRFSEESCNTFEPVVESVDWNSVNLGPDSSSTSSSPSTTPERLQNDAQTSFTLQLDTEHYRRGRIYTLRLVGAEPFDGFMVGVRSEPGADGNRSVVGRFVDVPHLARAVKCGRARDAIVVDKGRPVRHREVSLQWRAPSVDEGELRVEASVAVGNAFTTIVSRPLTLNAFPVESDRCGRNFSCFRVCADDDDDDCDQDDALYIMAADVSRDQVKFRIGGIFPATDSYVALGMGRQRSDMAVADLVVCARREVPSVFDSSSSIGFPGQTTSGDDADENTESELYLSRFFLENDKASALEHRGDVRMDSFQLDSESEFGWCEYRRPLVAEDELDLNLVDTFYHFYFWGNLNNQSLPEMRGRLALYKSSRRVNVSDVDYNVVENNKAKFLRLDSDASHLSNDLHVLLLLGLVLLLGDNSARAVSTHF